MQKQHSLSLFLACAAGSAQAEILWQDDPQDIYAAGYFWPAYNEYVQTFPREPLAAARLGQLWGIFAREAGSDATRSQWQGWQQAEQRYRDGKYSEALAAFLPLAEHGNTLAQLRIADQYSEGKGAPVSGEHAEIWYSRAAQTLPGGAYPLYDVQIHAADTETRYQLAQMYLLGAGVRENDARAVDIMQALAAEGLAKAMLDLSDMYGGDGALPADPAQAVHWREEAAAHGDVAIRFQVAAVYAQEKNDGRARYWYERVAADGKDGLLTGMALDYLYDFAVRLGDAAQAGIWRDKAVAAWRPQAEAKDAYAQSRLGDLLSRGDAADLPQARQWLEKAVAQGDEEAAKRLQELR